MKGKTPKSTYYNKYGPSGSFTKAAAGNEKITSLFKVQTKDPEQFRYNTTEEALKKITELKEQLEKKHKEMNVIEYNQKRAIYEYLVLLDDKGCGRIDASLQIAKKVFIGAGPWKAQKIRYAANYWFLNNKLPMSRHGKHQKTVRLIDDEDVVGKCQ
ncbi:14051_t:CDS:2, partial [Entrophospora sp. SA101]